MPRRLSRLRIDEVSTVDKAANQHAQIKFWKRDPVAFYRKIFGAPPTLRDALDRAAANPALPRFAKQDDLDLDDDDIDDLVDSIDGRDGGDGNGGSNSEGSSTSRHISHIADMIAESAGIQREAALDWLLNHRNGLALLSRTLGKRQKEIPMPDSLSKVIDDHGLINVAKSIASGGSTGGATEHSLTAAIEVLAKRLYPDLSSAQAFATFFSADTPESLACRQAIQKLKHHPVAEAAPGVAGGGTVSGSPLDALWSKATELRKREPSLTREQAFARVYSAPENIDVVKRERAENRPHT